MQKYVDQSQLNDACNTLVTLYSKYMYKVMMVLLTLAKEPHYSDDYA